MGDLRTCIANDWLVVLTTCSCVTEVLSMPSGGAAI